MFGPGAGWEVLAEIYPHSNMLQHRPSVYLSLRPSVSETSGWFLGSPRLREGGVKLSLPQFKLGPTVKVKRQHGSWVKLRQWTLILGDRSHQGCGSAQRGGGKLLMSVAFLQSIFFPLAHWTWVLEVRCAASEALVPFQGLGSSLV